MTIHDTQPIPPIVSAAVPPGGPAVQTRSGSRYALLTLVALLFLTIGGLVGAAVASSATFTQADIDQGRESGFADGYDRGLTEGKATAEERVREAYQAGFDSGFAAGQRAEDDGDSPADSSAGTEDSSQADREQPKNRRE